MPCRDKRVKCPKKLDKIESSGMKGLFSVKSRRQALQLCLNTAIVVVIKILDQFGFGL